MMNINIFFQLFILIFSVIIHEISHGFVALYFGDRTAEYEGRLTLNPLPHIDIWGSIIIPLLFWISGAGFIIGWAKPVPYNPYNLRNRKVAEPLVALAGPTSNLFLALVFGIFVRIMIAFGMGASPLIALFSFVVLVNVGLALFNLIPIPPLDGSKVLFSILPVQRRLVFSSFAARWGLLIIIVLILFASGFISSGIFSVFSLITGIH